MSWSREKNTKIQPELDENAVKTKLDILQIHSTFGINDRVFIAIAAIPTVKLNITEKSKTAKHRQYKPIVLFENTFLEKITNESKLVIIVKKFTAYVR